MKIPCLLGIHDWVIRRAETDAEIVNRLSGEYVRNEGGTMGEILHEERICLRCGRHRDAIKRFEERWRADQRREKERQKQAGRIVNGT